MSVMNRVAAAFGGRLVPCTARLVPGSTVTVKKGAKTPPGRYIVIDVRVESVKGGRIHTFVGVRDPITEKEYSVTAPYVLV